MKNIKVIVKDKNTIVLDEDANKGDYIDLLNLSSVDTEIIEKLIAEKKDLVYQNKLNEYRRVIDLENDKKLSEQKVLYENKINELNNVINDYNKMKESLLKEKELEFNLKLNELKSKSDVEIERLNNKINQIESNEKALIENEKLKLKDSYEKRINDLSIENNNIKQKNELINKEKELEFTKKINEIEMNYKKIIQDKDNQYLSLQRQKASLNVKQTGEDLEAWCDNEMKSYLQVGFYNTTWEKDNDVIREDYESKGSKADYIFKIYANEDLNPSEELASVCLEMKDENPDSSAKQTNEHYFKALDKNRNKKNCKYALLVSNLETDKPNDVPVYKAAGYDDMYVVRPAYMITFLSMLNSLTIRFKNLLLEGNKERMDLMNSIELKNKFEELKQRYLDKPLEGLSNIVEDIRKQSDGIKKICQKIDDDCDKAVRNYINEIQNKISKFDIEIDKAYRRYNKNGGVNNEIL